MGQSPKGDKCNSFGEGTPLLNGPTEFQLVHPNPVQWTTNPKKFSESGDLLFCVRGSTTGRMNWSDQEYAIGRGLAALSPLHEDTMHFFRGAIERHLPTLLAGATGSTFPNVSRNDLETIPIPYPDIQYIRNASLILKGLGNKIELNQKMNQTLEEIAKAIFKSWFVDFDPVRAKAEGRPTGLPSEISDLFPNELVDSEIGEIPKGWKSRTVQDVAKVTSGKRPPKKEKVRNDDCPFVVYGGAGPMAFCSEPLQFTKPAVITGRVGTLGKVFYLADDCWVSDNSILICDARSYTPLVFYTLQSIDLSALNVGSTQPLVTGKDIKNLGLIGPPEELLEEYTLIFDLVKTRQSVSDQESATLSELRDTLLPKLISGELRIPDAEKFLEEAGI